MRIEWKIWNILFLLVLIYTSSATPVQEPQSTFDTFKDVILKNEEIDSLNEPLLNLHNSNPDYTSICWAESLIITENKHTKNQTISKAYSILLDSPGNLQDLPEDSENASCYEVLEQNAIPKKTLNFTTVKETEDYIIKEHKTLFCGAGPVLSQHYIVWPKLKRKQIEISINPLGASKLRNCSDIRNAAHLESSHEDESNFDGDLRTLSGENELLGSKAFPSTKNWSTHPNTAESVLEYPPTTLGSEENDDIEEEGEEAPPKKIGAMHGSGGVSTKRLPKDSKNDEYANQAGRPTTEIKYSKENPRPSNKVRNSLLVRNFNCTVDDLGTCKEMIEKSKNFVGSSNSSKIVMGKWFFPEATLAGPLDKDRSFMLNVKLIVTLKKQNKNTQNSGEEEGEEDEDEEENKEETILVVEEECLYVIPKVKTTANTVNSP